MGAPSLGAAYGASKAGLEYLTKATAIQGAPHGITCNSVAPYAVDAGMALTAPVSIGQRHRDQPSRTLLHGG